MDKEYQQVIEDAWNVEPNETAWVKLLHCRANLSRWSKKKFGDTTALIKQKTHKLEELQRQEGPEHGEDIKKIKGEIELLLEHEDLWWKQQAKQNWYKGGDRNTYYFHAWANQRRRTNRIHKVQDTAGQVWQNPNEIPQVFTDYYRDLFTTGGVQEHDCCLEGMGSRVTSNMNLALTRDFMEKEVEEALAHMQPLKSPGPDGFSAGFYQQSWTVVRAEVCKTVLDFLNYGNFDSSLNNTHIALIPKV